MRLAAVAVAVVVLDQATKAALDPSGVEHYGTVLTEENSFGISAQFSTWSLVLRLLLVALIAWRIRPDWIAGLLIGGVVSNLVDTVWLNGVRDVIPVSTPWGRGDANVADVAWCVGLTALGVHAIIHMKGVRHGEDQDEDRPAGNAGRAGPGNSACHLPEDVHLGAPQPVSPVSGGTGDQDHRKEHTMRKLIARCRRCGFGRARDDGLCLSCKADEFNNQGQTARVSDD